MFTTPKRRYGPQPLVFIPSNYFGDGSDGALTAGAAYTANASGDMIVKNYTSINLPANNTIYTTNACSGILLYVQGDCIISGSINMTGKSYVATGSNDIYVYRILTSGTTQPSASLMTGLGPAAVSAELNEPYNWYNVGVTRTILNKGGAGGAKGNNAIYPLQRYGRPGSQITNGCGGGGGGSYYLNGQPDYSTNGASGSYSGGGAGGRAGGYLDQWPGGAGGGNVILVVKGNIIVSSTGTILANGVGGTNGTDLGGNLAHAGSGGGGGGSITLMYAGTYTNNGVVMCNGGPGGAASQEVDTQGGNGATGSLYTSSIAT